MNLTNTKRWNEFVEWYFNNDYHDDIELYSDENALNYEIDYSFYIKKVEEIIFSIEGNNKQTTLF